MAPEETPVRESDVSAFPVTFDRREGRILFSGVPVWFMTAQYYVDMQVQLESVIGKASKGILYRSAGLPRRAPRPARGGRARRGRRRHDPGLRPPPRRGAPPRPGTRQGDPRP